MMKRPRSKKTFTSARTNMETYLGIRYLTQLFPENRYSIPENSYIIPGNSYCKGIPGNSYSYF